MNNASMNGVLCPHCRVDLVMSERQGVEIDYCPKCRGIWLDRGELDKILERAASYETQLQQPAPAAGNPWGHAAPSSGHHGGYDKHGGHHGKRGDRHKSFLERFFD